MWRSFESRWDTSIGPRLSRSLGRPAVLPFPTKGARGHPGSSGEDEGSAVRGSQLRARSRGRGARNEGLPVREWLGARPVAEVGVEVLPRVNECFMAVLASSSV